jgi:HAD superfamily hydrolase (TIGR01549 family)
MHDIATATRQSIPLSGRRLRAPKALLLDFGGVVVRTARNADWQLRLAEHVRQRLDAAGVDPQTPAVTRIAGDIAAGAIADSHWKNAMSRPFAPRELAQRAFWGDFVAADWPARARDTVVAEAAELCRRMGHWRSRRAMRQGMIALLDRADAKGVPVGIASNALSGQVHHDFLREQAMHERFAAIVHSDEAGVRKPNPELLLLALRQLGVQASDAWYVGDNLDRDMLCGVRAGIGGNILMEAEHTWDMPYALDVRPDAIVAEAGELLALFDAALNREHLSTADA